MHKLCPVQSEMQPPPRPPPPSRPPLAARPRVDRPSGTLWAVQPRPARCLPGNLLMIPGLKSQCHLSPAGSLLHQTVFEPPQTGSWFLFAAPNTCRVGPETGNRGVRGCGPATALPPPPRRPTPPRCSRRRPTRRSERPRVAAAVVRTTGDGRDRTRCVDCVFHTLPVVPRAATYR